MLACGIEEFLLANFPARWVWRIAPINTGVVPCAKVKSIAPSIFRHRERTRLHRIIPPLLGYLVSSPKTDVAARREEKPKRILVHIDAA